MNQLKNWHAFNILFEYYHLLRPSSCRLSITRLMFLFRNFNHFGSLAHVLYQNLTLSLSRMFTVSNFKLLICMSMGLFVCEHYWTINIKFTSHICTKTLCKDSKQANKQTNKPTNQPQHHKHHHYYRHRTTFCLHTICVSICWNSIL